MGSWTERVLPRLVDRALASPVAVEVRQEVVRGLHGDVLEIGFGSGLNVPHYPSAVRRVLAVEPSAVARRLAAPRVAARGLPVEEVGLDAQVIDLPDGSVDTALSTWTLCTVPDPVAALREVRRVLRPGGALHLAEHARSPDPRTLRWQSRLDPLQRRMAGGCTFLLDPVAVLAEAGFATDEVRHRTLPLTGPGLLLASTYLGRAAI